MPFRLPGRKRTIPLTSQVIHNPGAHHFWCLILLDPRDRRLKWMLPAHSSPGLILGRVGKAEEGEMLMDDERSLINDIQGDLTDAEIMEKHQLSAAKLRRRLLQLMSENAVNSADVYWRPILYDYEVSNGDKRAIPRYPLALLLPVNEMGSAESTSGFLIDINEKGGCVKGISPSLGARVALRIEPGPLISANEIILEVAFRWVERVGDTDFLAGFEILSTSQRDAVLLRELIRTIVRMP